ncbi:molybdate ABC transporter substrate-binding protein [Flavivirga spongiicola]|uniref:Molybdate ABC transporter substrate-binding protein n=1 Tax=Flavivirga spongiicola TaxID=421621 RepID=A0ABU7XPF8_9FLAO|nr:molybdate ABC transporter substrate-binding protein [Flavivirga sp. MEBiC05379]MDO5977416.1 molybdate ABC transporter substrate-binding protein [Flavivirga sp. MEBiC05379]
MFVKWNRLLLLLMVISIGCVSCKQKEEQKSLLLYCAAGMKPVVEKVTKQYYQEYGIRIDVQYGGSGTLLSNLRVARHGDLYLAADKSYINEAISFGLVKETQSLAFIQPVIAVAKGNPKKVHNIEDLCQDTIKVAIANPDAASIGRLTKKMLTESNHWNALSNNVSVLMPTVNEVANTIKLGTTDAGIIWDVTASQYDDIDIVNVPLFKNYIKNITIGVLNYSTQATEALKFIRYISAKDKGLPVFKKFAYQPIVGDVWSEKPKLLFYSGGVNRLAIDKTIQAFEKREGVEVNRVYNGCGILVSQIKAGQQPDAYLSCDVSFMTQVEDEFNTITDISKTSIVIAVEKGNPKKIQSLNDLTANGLQLGICNHNQSALGALTKRLLESQNIWEAVYKNVRSQTPTADLLVNQIRTGSLDAVVVYEANIAQVKDKLDMIRLSEDQANAIQNFGISTNSENQNIMKRLLKALTDENSKKKYLDNGFEWKYSKTEK